MDTSLVDQVKHNCDVSDARYWGYFTICGLLLRLRDLYRSEHDLRPWAQIDREDIAQWIARKEAPWPELEREDFRDLSIHGKQYRPFEVFEINHVLKRDGLVYGAGYGLYKKPSFFLAELKSVTERFGHTVYCAGREYARDVFSSPGMLQGQCIFIRLEPLMAFLWDKFSEAAAKKGAYLQYGFSHYGIHAEPEADSGFEHKFKEMTHRYAEIILHHELAEAMESTGAWREMLSRIEDRGAEYFVRAVMDLLADTSDHGPLKRIISTKDKAALGLFIALTEGYRRTLYSDLKAAFQEFIQNEDWHVLEEIRKTGYKRFLALAEEMLTMHRIGGGGEDFLTKLRDLITGRVRNAVRAAGQP